jgi:hypothetical protein
MAAQAPTWRHSQILDHARARAPRRNYALLARRRRKTLGRIIDAHRQGWRLQRTAALPQRRLPSSPRLA